MGSQRPLHLHSSLCMQVHSEWPLESEFSSLNVTSTENPISLLSETFLPYILGLALFILWIREELCFSVFLCFLFRFPSGLDDVCVVGKRYLGGVEGQGYKGQGYLSIFQ